MILATGLSDYVAGSIITLITIVIARYGLLYVQRQDKAKADAVLETTSDVRTVDLIQKLQESQQYNIDRATNEIDLLREQFRRGVAKWRADKAKCDKEILDLHTRLTRMETELEFYRHQP